MVHWQTIRVSRKSEVQCGAMKLKVIAHEAEGAAIGLRFLLFPAARLRARRLKSCYRMSMRQLKAAFRVI